MLAFVVWCCVDQRSRVNHGRTVCRDCPAGEPQDKERERERESVCVCVRVRFENVSWSSDSFSHSFPD